MVRPLVLTTPRSHYFAESIAGYFDAELVETQRKEFKGGERYLRIDIKSRTELGGRDVIFAASPCLDDDFNEVERVIGTAAGEGVRSITCPFPFMGYGGMERAVKPGEVVTAKDIARQLSELPHARFALNAYLLMDTHVPNYTQYFEKSCICKEYYAEPVLVQAIERLGLTNFIFGTADLSRVKWAKTYAKIFKTRIAIVDKDRDFESTSVNAVIGDVEGMNVLIYDDMVRSADSIMGATNAYLERGALSVSVVASHLSLNDESVIDRLEQSRLVRVVSTNSHPMSQHPKVLGSDKFMIEDVSRLYIDPIHTLT